MIKRLLFAVFVLALPVHAAADGAFWTGGSFGGGGGGVSSSADLELDVGTKLIFDADADSNNYIYAVNDTTMYTYVEGVLSFLWNQNGIGLNDDKRLSAGDSTDYWWIYDSANTQLELNSTNCDGGGTDCVVLSVDDGDAILDLQNGEFISNDTDGKITLGGAGGTNNEDIIFDFETSANRLEITSSTGLTLWDFNSTSIIPSQVYSNLYNSTSGVNLAGINFDAVQADTMFTSSASYGNQWIFGPGASYTKDFDHAAQTNPTVYVHSDTDPDTDNTQWLSLSHDVTQGRIETGTGKIALGGAGGTFNEDIIFDFDAASNYVRLSSTTGASVFDLGSNAWTVLANVVRVNTAGYFYWPSKTELYSDADGQLQIEQSDNTVGVTLDGNDAAGTLVIKDQAGTAAGNLGLLSTGKLILDHGDDANNYFEATDTVINVYVEGSSSFVARSNGLRLLDSKSLQLGTDADQKFTYTDGTGVQWNDGTNDVITVPDDTGHVTFGGGINLSVVSIDSDDSAYAVPATAHVIVCDPDTGAAPGDTTVTLPDSTGGGRTIIVKNIGTTYDCLVDPFDGTDQIDNSGAGTAVTVDTKGSLTVIDVGATNFQWIIE